MKNLLLCVSIALLLHGCLVGPNYQPPAPVICDQWSSDFLANHHVRALYEQPPTLWWQVFNDPLLTKYIEMAACHNNDILAAEANICQARALRQVAASDLFPHISADLNATRTYFSKNGPVFAFNPGGGDFGTLSSGLPFDLQIPQTQNLFNALIDATWELDFFGKRHRAVEAAEANIGSAIEEKNDVLISILAEVAINYMELRSNQNMGILLEENIKVLEKNAFVVAKRVEAGYSNQLDLELIQAQLAQAIANLPSALANILQNIYALSALTGNLPEALLQELLPMRPLPCPPRELAVGIRSDLLRRRPDVRKAERDLAAATANIGVAVASFYPSFNLIGDIGLQALSLSKLFQARSLTYAFGGDINIPIFQGGKLVGNLRANEAKTKAAAFTYQQKVLTALQEAETSIAFYAQDLKTTEDLAEAASRYKRLVFLTNEQYTKGLISLIDLLQIEQQWNTAEQNFLRSATTTLIDLIILYKALGGGWEPSICCN